uniref:lipase maturation factor 2-like n=1 Tax=Myxine glutinosa TaxID=7769 RepID=UPI00358F7D99
MASVVGPRKTFLWSLSVIYAIAFISLYVQVPGLYGKDGILPVWKLASEAAGPRASTSRPALLSLATFLSLSPELCLEITCLLGTCLALCVALAEPLRDCVMFLGLWFLYLTVHQVGQVFLYFQWDSLLLEVGWLAVLVAPLNIRKWREVKAKPHDSSLFWLVRWLLFRLMFASGVVKLTSRCPTWWGLAALHYHYESQCIPTPLAWFAHQFPAWFQQLCVVGTYVIEIALPLLFFSPFRRHRLFAAYSQVFLQAMIILTGNYNFFNLLTIALCLSLADDSHHQFGTPDKKRHSWGGGLVGWIALLVELSVYLVLAVCTIWYFNLQLDWSQGIILSQTMFTYYDFTHWLGVMVPLTILAGTLSLGWEIISGFQRCLSERGFFRQSSSMIQWAFFSVVAAAMFSTSLVPYSYLHPHTHDMLWPAVRKLHAAVDPWQLSSSYGLFRRMTGVGGRPEVVIEGSWELERNWKELEFMYKPGNISTSPSFITPHQPRLDWQMWFAALGDRQQSPWFACLLLRILEGKEDVLRLIQSDQSNYPFVRKPPIFVRAQLYKYHYTSILKNGSLPQAWWWREWVNEFHPTVHLRQPQFEFQLAKLGCKGSPPADTPSTSQLHQTVTLIGRVIRSIPPHHLTTALCLIALLSILVQTVYHTQSHL